ncbi:hypothetical protein A9308_00750 [Moraxella atlantae]|uniref:PD-(D/E)XK endonuclease-like domain-containing protein n=1 Tax=Faucicola atlantae TaxID=34059 RepID=A0A1B8Q988_9GAMM|nr:PD-(D/E)XK nuclease family protein [Moraxella atlantae]OBX73770.1 hypothetical protein A9308_00750 [Moraxella atlantae]
MADIRKFITPPDSTVNAIYAAIKAAHNETPRNYLGASIIGKPCARQLWQDFRWVACPDYDGRLLRLFETGHLEEIRLTKNLRQAGLTVYDIDANTGQQFAIVMHGGHFRGHADGVCLGIKDAPKTWHLLEYKTHSQKSFDTLTAQGVEKAKPEHFAQMQIYMHGLKLTRAYYLARNKNTDELYGERIKYDPDFAERMIERAHRIIFANEPPAKISERPDWYLCKFCDYHCYCHAGSNDLPEPLPNVNCRTCIHATPTPDGGWLCEYQETAIGEELAHIGCPEHRYIPMLFPNLSEPYAEGNNVFYRGKSGTNWMNDKRGEMNVQT